MCINIFREVSLWDIRKLCKIKIEPILKFEHPEALSSAFFSASGSNMVSTCNDDYIRIFNTTTLTKTDTGKLKTNNLSKDRIRKLLVSKYKIFIKYKIKVYTDLKCSAQLTTFEYANYICSVHCSCIS